MNCPFCQKQDLVLENDLAQAFYDTNPVSLGHLLMTPKRHEADFFALSLAEVAAMYDLLAQAKPILDEKYHPQAYNLGINCGRLAGQTIFHCHLHLIPRYTGDVADARGGVRGVIPDKQTYDLKEKE